jgi:hypothetical protein
MAQYPHCSDGLGAVTTSYVVGGDVERVKCGLEWFELLDERVYAWAAYSAFAEGNSAAMICRASVSGLEDACIRQLEVRDTGVILNDLCEALITRCVVRKDASHAVECQG